MPGAAFRMTLCGESYLFAHTRGGLYAAGLSSNCAIHSCFRAVFKTDATYVCAVAVQLVDRLDQGAFSHGTNTMTYQGLYRLVAKALYRTHVEGKLKGEIIQVCKIKCVSLYVLLA